jgi:hypothetical protein
MYKRITPRQSHTEGSPRWSSEAIKPAVTVIAAGGRKIIYILVADYQVIITYKIFTLRKIAKKCTKQQYSNSL